MQYTQTLCVVAILLAATFPLGCETNSPRPTLETEADSLAWRITEAHGGLEAWEALSILRFDYVEGTDSTETVRAHHLWDRRNDRYRVEWSLDKDSLNDSLVVALFRPSDFDPENPRGSAIVDNVRLQGEDLDNTLQEAYRRFVHDSFWLLAPLRLFDPGVRRRPAPDSSTSDRIALALSVEDTHAIPGDRYWIYADRTSGVVQGWTFQADDVSRPKRLAWSEPVRIQLDGEMLTFLITKRGPDGTVIHTPVGPPGDAGALLTDLSNRLLPLNLDAEP